VLNKIFTIWNSKKTYNKAIKGKHVKEWLNAINKELSNLYNNTMTFVESVPNNKNIITKKSVFFSIKKDGDNNIINIKARFVARGFDQKYGIDY